MSSSSAPVLIGVGADSTLERGSEMHVVNAFYFSSIYKHTRAQVRHSDKQLIIFKFSMTFFSTRYRIHLHIFKMYFGSPCEV